MKYETVQEVLKGLKELGIAATHIGELFDLARQSAPIVAPHDPKAKRAEAALTQFRELAAKIYVAESSRKPRNDMKCHKLLMLQLQINKLGSDPKSIVTSLQKADKIITQMLTA